MPTLLQLNCTANWGSTGKIAEQIGLCAQTHGWESYIAYGRANNPSKNKLIKVGSTLDVYEHYAENCLLDNEGLASRCATRTFLKEVDAIKPDVIQLHNIHDHWLNYRILFEYLNATDIPVVWTFHDCWAFTGHCPHFVTVNCEKWKTGCFECPLKNSLVDRSQRNFQLKKQLFSANKNLHVVTVSQWLHDFVKQSFLSDKDVSVIHNGIDLNVFRPNGEKSNGKFQILGVSSVWHQSKGLYDFYKLRESLDVEQFDITLVGLKPEQIQQLPEGIKGIERTNSVQELAALYSQAHVLVNPTYADSFPTVNLEALACGTPVITYRTGGSPEAVDEKTGIVVEQGDVEALVSAICHLKEHPLSADDCRKRAEACFNKDRCFEEYVELYENLLNK